MSQDIFKEFTAFTNTTPAHTVTTTPTSTEEATKCIEAMSLSPVHEQMCCDLSPSWPHPDDEPTECSKLPVQGSKPSSCTTLFMPRTPDRTVTISKTAGVPVAQTSKQIPLRVDFWGKPIPDRCPQNIKVRHSEFKRSAAKLATRTRARILARRARHSTPNGLSSRTPSCHEPSVSVLRDRLHRITTATSTTATATSPGRSRPPVRRALIFP